MTLSEPMERDLRPVMRHLRAYATVDVYLRVVGGTLRIRTEGKESERVASYARNGRTTFEQVCDMIREDVAFEVAQRCR